jgi:ubiquinone/menaquinone biosynthesis C-methylase UbiE
VRKLGLEDTLEKALLRDEFIKEDSKKIVLEGVDVDEVFLKEIAVRVSKGSRILDVGAGTGHVALEIARRIQEIEIFAMDLSRASTQIAKQNIEATSHDRRIQVIRADGYHLPFKDQCFDEVIVRLAPHSIAEAYRVLRDDGWYILRAAGEHGGGKEIKEIFGERALPFATADWWKTSTGRLERVAYRGFRDVQEFSYLVKKYYTLEQIIKEMRFDPVVKDFDQEIDMPKLKELGKKYVTGIGICLTTDPLILLGRK